MVMKKRLSKRTKLARKYSIKKKINEHNRKERRDAKKKPKSTKPKKDPGIPNSFPFKEELLNEIEKQRQEVLEEKQRQKEARQAEKRKEKAKQKKTASA